MEAGHLVLFFISVRIAFASSSDVSLVSARISVISTNASSQLTASML